MVIFFSAFMAILFHLGIVQLMIDKPSIIATKVLKTTGPETLNAIANIFVSMVRYGIRIVIMSENALTSVLSSFLRLKHR